MSWNFYFFRMAIFFSRNKPANLLRSLLSATRVLSGLITNKNKKAGLPVNWPNRYFVDQIDASRRIGGTGSQRRN